MDSFGGIDPLGMTKIDTASSLSSRQKSCNACVRGKRRCDKRTPRCTRCAAKGLDCVYHKMPPGQGSGSDQRGQQSQTASTGSTTPEMADVPDFDMGFEYESLDTETSPESMCHIPDQAASAHQHHQHHHQHQQPQQEQPFHLGPGLDFDIAAFMNATGVPTAHTTSALSESSQGLGVNNNGFFANLFDNAAPTGASKMDIPPVPFSTALVPQHHNPLAAKVPIRDLSLLNKPGACHHDMDPLAVHDPRSWMGYTVNVITSMHHKFAQTRALPFIHPRLWATNLPKPILSVFSAATAYSNRSADNKAWIMKLLADTAVSVHRDGEKPSGNHEKLARVQALLVLDSIRVFDGDLGLRAAAEREASVLSSWLLELQELIGELEAEAVQYASSLTVPGEGLDTTATSGMGAGGAPGTYPSRDRPPKNWDSWILLESARRTLLFGCAFICMNKMLKSMDASPDMWKDLTFTASRHLWEAPSSVEFFRAWKDRPQYFIRHFDFKDFWSYARPDDLDEFTKTMLMPQIGFDALEHFMAEEHTGAAAAV